MTNQMPERIYLYGSDYPSAVRLFDVQVEYTRADLAQKTVTRDELEQIKELLENCRYIPSGHDEAANALSGYMEQCLGIVTAIIERSPQ